MTITPKLRNYLPKHYCKTLRERIHDKTDRWYSTNYIAMCLADPPTRHNDDILNEAALWAIEIRDMRLSTAEKLESLAQ